MKVFRTLITILAFLLGISFAIFLISGSAAQAAINEPVTEEYYEMLKGNAMKVARTLDVNVVDDEAITADFYFSKEEMVVTVKSFKAKITATIPISIYCLEIEDGTVEFQGKAEYEGVKYIGTNELQPAWWYIVMAIAGGALMGIMAYVIVDSICFPTKKE